MMELTQIKKQISEVLVKENIKHVFHVDDRVSHFNSTKSSILASLRKEEPINGNQILVDILQKHGIDVTDEDEFVVNEIEKILSPENPDFFKSLAVFYNLEEERNGEDEDNDAYDIEKYFNKGQFTALEPGGAIEIIEKKMKAIGDEGKLLVLFDLDLKEAGGEFIRVTGVEMLVKLKEKDNNNQCICSIFTHLVKNVGDEIARRKQILDGQEGVLNKSNLFVLAKKRKNDSIRFGDGIKKIVLNPHYENVKQNSVDLLSEAFKRSKDELGDIDTYEFDHMILHASNIEGVWAGETLLRIFNVIFDKHVKDRFVDEEFAKTVNPFFENAIKLARLKFPVDTNEIPEFNRNRIRNLELYLDSKLINGLFEPINNGDIFEVNHGKSKQTYILVAQECDIILRSNGKRNRKNDFFTMLKIDFKPKESVETEISDFTNEYGLKNYYFSNRFLLNNYDNSNSDLIGVVDFRNELMIYSTIIDLTSFNSDGEAKFDSSKEYPLASFSQALRNRFKVVSHICQEKLTFLNKTESELNQQGVKDAKLLALRFVETLSPTNRSIGNLNPFENGMFDFGLRRVKRLKTNWANKLLERYGYYLSRPADLPDYTDSIDPKNIKIG
jgi:hypothetical protein